MSAAKMRLETTARGRAAGALQLSGGALMVMGAALPWLTLFAGLQAYRGILGWNGRGMLAAGAVVALGGAASLAGKAGLLVRRVVSLLAALVAGSAVVLVVRLIATWRELMSRDVMMLARPDLGLPVVVVGAIVAAAAIFVDGSR
jgi:hypothetical protein